MLEARVDARTTERPRRPLLVAAALTSGPGEVAEFLLPLWAGVQLGVSAGVSGGLLALLLVGAVVGRFLGGRFVDRGLRLVVALAATVMLTVGMAGFALAGSVPVAALAAVLVGAGGSLFMVSVMAHLADLCGGTSRYGVLFSWESFGGLAAFVVVLGLFDVLTFPMVFGGLAAALVVSIALVAASGMPHRVSPSPSTPMTRVERRRLAPVIGLIGITALAQSALLLLAMFQLQRELSLEIQDVGLLLGPGYLLLVTAGAWSHRVTTRIGPAATLYVALAAATTTALLLSLSQEAVGVAVAWCAAAIGLGLAHPVERAAVASKSDGRVGRAFGLQGVAALGGGALGAALAGWLFDVAPWTVACVVPAAITAIALVLVKPAVRP
jgi:MFS transporter, DHA1 family, multidrug resistance protein